MFSGNQPPSKRRVPHNSFSRNSSSGIPQPSTSTGTSSSSAATSALALPPLTASDILETEEERGAGESNNDLNNHNNNNNNVHAPFNYFASTSNPTMTGGRSSTEMIKSNSYTYGAPNTRIPSMVQETTSFNNNNNNNNNHNNFDSIVSAVSGEGRTTRSRSRSRSVVPEEERVGSTSGSSSNNKIEKGTKQRHNKKESISNSTRDVSEVLEEIIEEELVEQLPLSQTQEKKKLQPFSSEIETNRIKKSATGNGSSRTSSSSNLNSTNARPSSLPGRNYPNGTSVNIATAFTQALENEAGIGSSSSNNLNRGGREIGIEIEKDIIMSGSEEEEGGKETQNTGSGNGNYGDEISKKRKKRTSDDSGYKPEAQEAIEASEPESDLERSNAAKRAKKSVSVEPTRDSPKHTSPSARRKRTSGDATYKPTQTSSLENPSASSSSSSEDERTKRRRSKVAGKGKGRTSSDAIPIGRRDSEVWSGQKKKKKSKSKGGKGKKKAGDDGRNELEDTLESGSGMETGSGMDTADGEAGGENEGEEEAEELGGYDYQPNGNNDEEEGVEVPVLASYFLRPKSPSPIYSPEPSRSGSQRQDLSQSRPFTFQSRYTPREPTLDPSFAAFDRSLNQSGEREGNSYEEGEGDGESGVRGSSYDYSEEERIVAAIEAEKARELAESQARRQGDDRGRSTPSSSNLNTLGGGSTRIRRNRIPSPPRIMEPIEEEELPNTANGVGRKMGEAVRPLVNVWRKTQNPMLDWWKIWRAIGLTLAGVFVLSLLIRSPNSTAPSNKSLFNDYIPFINRFTSPFYSAPDLPAETFDILVKRLARLEKSLEQLSTLSESDRTTSEIDRNRVNNINDQFLELESNFDQDRRRVLKATEQIELSSAKDIKDFEKIVGEIRSDLSSLVSRVKNLGEDTTSDKKVVESLKSGVESVGKEIGGLNNKLDQVSKELQSKTAVDQISKIALEVMEIQLPSKLAVRLDSKGNLIADPAFWKHLKEAFVQNKDLESILKSKIDFSISKLPSSKEIESIVDGKINSEISKLPKIKEIESTIDSKLEAQISKLPTSKDVVSMVNSRVNSEVAKITKPDVAVPKIVTKEPTWKDFLNANEETLKNWVEADIKGRFSSDAIVSKKSFLDTLHKEIKLLKSDFETKSNENVQKIGEELLNKVARQEQLRVETLARLKASQPPLPPVAQVIRKPAFDTQNVSVLVGTLVDTALLKYSKDVLAKPDYALGTAGGRIVPSLTSATYEARPLGLAPKLLGWVTGTGSSPGRPPVTALHPYNSPGYCWPFAGSQGQLGILLSRIIIPTEITFEHVSKDVAVDGDVSSAPRDFEVWGVVEGKEDTDKLKDYREAQLLAKRKKLNDKKIGEVDLEEEEEPASSVPPTASHILLAIGSYDINSSSPVQTFPVTSAAKDLGIPVGLVIVKILSNHGESHYTCLYRVRVSGISLSQVMREGSEKK